MTGASYPQPMIHGIRGGLHTVLIILLAAAAYATAIAGVVSRWKLIELAFPSDLSDPEAPGVAVEFNRYRLKTVLVWRIEGTLSYKVWRHSALGVTYFGAESSDANRPGSSVRVRRLTLPFWLPAVLLFAYPIVAYYRGPRRRQRWRDKGLCLHCAYDLTGNVSGICPECGEQL